MIRILITIVTVLVSNLFCAQSVFDKYDKQEGVSSIVVNKKMFQMMGSVKADAGNKETQQYLNLLRKLDNMKVFTIANKKVSDAIKLTADDYTKTAGLQELMQVDDSGKRIKVWIKSGTTDTHVKELLMYSEDGSRGYETVLILLEGSFELNEIAVLIDKMKIPGGNDLKKVTQEKK